MRRTSRLTSGTMVRWGLPLVALAALLLSPLPVRGQGGPRTQESSDGNRHPLAVGHPYEDVFHGGSQANAGAASVIYDSARGLAPASAETWHQGRTAENLPGQDNLFGHALAIGDFDGDGLHDLAVGIPGEEIGGQKQAGAVHVLYGGGGGLLTRAGQFWHLNRPGVGGVAGEGDAFGHALAAADFDGDGFDDLSVGAPGYDLGALADIGVVSVIYGSSEGLATPRYQFWYQGPLAGLADEPEEGDRFGYALGIGDFDCDGRVDLAIGVPQEDLENGVVVPNAGAVHILHGSGDGLSAAGDQLWVQEQLGQSGALDGDQFGYALTSGDFDGNGCSDLAVGMPGESAPESNAAATAATAGAVQVIYGDGSGLSLAQSQFWTLDSLLSAPDGAAPGDRFGQALAAGDFDADGHSDLAVGAPGVQINAAAGAGAVSIIYGSGSGLSMASGDQYFTQPLRAGGSQAESLDHFGQALAAGDFDGDGAVDLAVGVPQEDDDQTDARNTGLVQVLYGQPDRRLSGDRSQTWNEADLGGLPQEGDQFGYALASSMSPLPPGGHEVYAPLVEGDEGP